MNASGLLISCATPAASVPTDSMRSAIVILDNSSRRSPTSRNSTTFAGAPSNVSRSASASTSTVVPSPRSMRRLACSDSPVAALRAIAAATSARSSACTRSSTGRPTSSSELAYRSSAIVAGLT